MILRSEMEKDGPAVRVRFTPRSNWKRWTAAITCSLYPTLHRTRQTYAFLSCSRLLEMMREPNGSNCDYDEMFIRWKIGG